MANAGAYVKLGGTIDVFATRVWVDGCLMDSANGPCVWVEGGTSVVWVADSTLSCTGSSPTVFIDDSIGTDIMDVKVLGNRIESTTGYAVRSTQGTLTRIQIQQNAVLGLVDCVGLERSQFQNNSTFLDIASLTAAVVSFSGCYGMQIQSNIIGRSSTPGIGRLVKLDTCERTQLHRNDFIQEKTGSGLVHAVDSTDLQIHGNISITTNAGSSTVAAYLVEADAENITNLQISGDQITAAAGTWKYAVHFLSTAGTLGNILVVPGIYDDCVTGVYFDTNGAAASRFPGIKMVAGGIIDCTTSSFDFSVSGLYVRIGGNASTKGPNIWAGNGTPEGNVASAVGSEYARLDGGAGTARYTKETGAATAAGWVGK